MRLKFYASRNDDGSYKHQPKAISSALQEVVKLYGDEIEIVHNAVFEKEGVDFDIDVACVWGIMGNSHSIVSQYLLKNKRVLMFDKALIRHIDGGARGYFRVGIDGPSPVKYIMRVPRNFDRFEFRRIDLQNRIELNIIRPKVLYCGSSQKYCDFYGLGDANEYAANVFKQVRESSIKASILYRPKPSWDGAIDIEGSEMSGVNRSLKLELERSNILITHGSAASVEAIVAGLPVITLGPCVAQFVANRTIDSKTLLHPYFPSDNARWQWLCNLAYCQWNEEEFRSGEAWSFIRNEITETTA